ncbi:universal stress protein [Rhodoferax sp.]|uniref:universal stress protein n=1 Tax=Rhodoferax sp. TaxID=50421 RepID=UPI0008B3AD7C|nr:universal stress protein [Rhodoferax sp.]OGB39424.1 MAG: universal stress protein UspA [Burkholderiales bacterium RIFOXYC2_FULL_59_8]OGB56889.1 MAG: universal stress protein UspA [Burkholderiales bacterium RIFOXYD12_FULL_59_19]OGB80538.1 MAG: universal stress protein UspA [Burkholderiales bacterium RIFOXYC12_FULL_60_6]MDO8317669.1 universal stress protein [Rhodoferax sp.]MDP2677839.1 universal stress protein [Rhodoferax sp.]
MKILLAVDGSPFTKKMLAYLAAHELFSSKNEYTAFTAQMMLPTQARAALGKELVAKYYEDEGQRVMNPVAKFLERHGVKAKVVWKTGNAGELIAKLAEVEKFDLVVMGSHGHGALVNLVVGSVATKVLANCKVPVLIVR